MPKRPETYNAILTEVARPSDRSSLFWFLVEHHDEITEQAGGKRMPWHALCALFSDYGLTDIGGRAATPATARKTWFRARRLVAATRARQQKQGRPGQVSPSRVSSDWRPEVVPPPPMRPPPPPQSLVPVAASGTARAAAEKHGIVLSPKAQAVLDGALQMLKDETRKQFPFG